MSFLSSMPTYTFEEKDHEEREVRRHEPLGKEELYIPQRRRSIAI